jgi:pimeloyl-ACP methyl ester carboxylesterase
MRPKDISVVGNLPQAAFADFSEKEKEIVALAQELDARFLPQFERREFTYLHHAHKMKSYLPEGLHDDANLVRDQHVRISYNYWEARDNPETAETIICLGGIYNSARRFDFFAEGAARNFNVIALDYPGKGHSANLRMPSDYTLETYADIVTALIDHAAPAGKFHLLGHSHGTKVIYTMVEQGFSNPNWASTVIGDMPPETPPGPKLRRAWRNRERPFSHSMEEAVKRLENFLQGHGAPVSREFVVHDFNHGFEHHTREGFGWAYDPNSMQGYADEYLLPYDKWQAYKDLPTPVLILAGEKSNTATPEAVKRMLEERPDASLLVYEGVGHYPELVTPRRIAEVAKWIKHAGDPQPLRALVPADPEKPMFTAIVQDNNPPVQQQRRQRPQPGGVA